MSACFECAHVSWNWCRVSSSISLRDILWDRLLLWSSFLSWTGWPASPRALLSPSTGFMCVQCVGFQKRVLGTAQIWVFARETLSSRKYSFSWPLYLFLLFGHKWLIFFSNNVVYLGLSGYILSSGDANLSHLIVLINLYNELVTY